MVFIVVIIVVVLGGNVALTLAILNVPLADLRLGLATLLPAVLDTMRPHELLGRHHQTTQLVVREVFGTYGRL